MSRIFTSTVALQSLMQGFEGRVHAFSAHLVALIPDSPGRRSQRGDKTAFIAL